MMCLNAVMGHQLQHTCFPAHAQVQVGEGVEACDGSPRVAATLLRLILSIEKNSSPLWIQRPSLMTYPGDPESRRICKFRSSVCCPSHKHDCFVPGEIAFISLQQNAFYHSSRLHTRSNQAVLQPHRPPLSLPPRARFRKCQNRQQS